jgi:hypothetical protein
MARDNKKDTLVPPIPIAELVCLKFLPKKNRIINTRKGVRARKAAEMVTYSVADSSCISILQLRHKY